MRFVLIVAVVWALAQLSSCSPHVDGVNVVEQFKKDTTSIHDYVSLNSIPAAKLAQGIWFVVDQMGNGGRANFTDTVTLAYKLRLLPSGTIVEDKSATQADYNLFNLPPGVQVALPLYPSGSKGRIFLPSYYGFQNQANGSVPPNSNLIFEFSLLGVTDYHLKKDTILINDYIHSHDINASFDPSGMRYSIDSLGTGQLPQVTDSITFKYTAKLFDGSILQQQTTPVTFLLSDLILAWKIALPLIPAGSYMTIYAPSSYAYGSNPSGSAVLPNTNFIFNVKLVKVKGH